MGQQDNGGNGKATWNDLPQRGQCDECEPGRRVHAHEMRLMHIENDVAAGIAEDRATRDAIRTLNLEFGCHFKQVIDNQVEHRKEMIELKEQQKSTAEKIEAIQLALAALLRAEPA